MIVSTETRYEVKPDCKTSKEMTEICCRVANALQCCQTISPWGGYSREEIEKRHNLDGRDEIRFLGRVNPCGKKIVDYDTSQNNCCEDIDPLEFPQDDIVMSPGSRAQFQATGGKPPYSYSSSELIYEGAGVFLAPENFCGMAIVSVQDACEQSAGGMVRSSVGYWDDITDDVGHCAGSSSGEVVGAGTGTCAVGGANWWGITSEHIVGDTKSFSNIRVMDWNSDGTMLDEPCGRGANFGSLQAGCELLVGGALSGGCCMLDDKCYHITENIGCTYRWKCA